MERCRAYELSEIVGHP